MYPLGCADLTEHLFAMAGEKGKLEMLIWHLECD